MGRRMISTTRYQSALCDFGSIELARQNFWLRLIFRPDVAQESRGIHCGATIPHIENMKNQCSGEE